MSARELADAITQRATKVAQKESYAPQRAIVRDTSPLSAELAQHRHTLVEGEDFSLSQWVRKYDLDHSIAEGDTLVLLPVEGESSDYVAIDVEAEETDLAASATVGLTPVGAPIPWLVSSIPSGFLEFNGQAINAATYPKLAALFGANLPDLRNRVLMGASGTHPIGEALGAETHTLSMTEMPSHSHRADGAGGAGGVTGASTSGDDSPDHAHSTAGATARHAHSVQAPNTAAGYGLQSGSAFYAQSVLLKGGGAGNALYCDTDTPDHAHGTYGASVRHQHYVPSLGINTAGSDVAHNNLQPYRTVRWITAAA